MKRGGYIQRRTPLRCYSNPKPTSWLKSLTPLRKVNPDRKKKRQEEGLVYGPYHRWVGKFHPCLVFNSDCWGPISGHHVDPVGNGGQDLDNEVALCEFHHLHDLHHHGRPAFEQKHRHRYGGTLNLEDAAHVVALMYPGKDWEG